MVSFLRKLHGTPRRVSGGMAVKALVVGFAGCEPVDVNVFPLDRQDLFGTITRAVWYVCNITLR